MAFAGSVITKNMEYNQIYAGSPAKSISDKVGYQFNPVTVEDKLKAMNGYIQEWNGDSSRIKIVSSTEEMLHPDEFTYFNVADRTYNKRATPAEIDFMKFLLPAKGKFTPLTSLA